MLIHYFSWLQNGDDLSPILLISVYFAVQISIFHIIIIIIIPLFVHQCHEQEIPEVIPIEGIPFLNQSKSNQLNLTQHKSNQINQMLVFEERGKPKYPDKNLSEQSREPTNSAHLWRQVRESNPGHIGGSRVLYHCANLLPKFCSLSFRELLPLPSIEVGYSGKFGFGQLLVNVSRRNA